MDEARKDADHSQVKQVGVDETSRRRGHNYASLFVDLEQSRVLFATDGKDASTVQRFKQDLIEHGGDPGAIKEMGCDMSPTSWKELIFLSKLPKPEHAVIERNGISTL